MTTPEEDHQGLIVTGSRAIVRRMDLRLELVGRLMEEIQTRESSGTGAELAELAATRAISLQGMVQVAAGRLPASSELGSQSVDPFFIAKTAVTWSEWQTVRTWAAANGYDLDNVGTGEGPDHPVTNVYWYQSLKWCNARSEMECLTPVYKVGKMVYRVGDSIPTLDTAANGYRLPSEKEWEFAARGGVKSNGYKYSGSDDISAVAWWHWNTDTGTNAVATKQANELGLSDMSGNVLEWCFDDPFGSGSRRVMRGGYWAGYEDDCLIVDRDFNTPTNSNMFIGFRIVRSSVP